MKTLRRVVLVSMCATGSVTRARTRPPWGPVTGSQLTGQNVSDGQNHRHHHEPVESSGTDERQGAAADTAAAGIFVWTGLKTPEVWTFPEANHIAICCLLSSDTVDQSTGSTCCYLQCFSITVGIA